MLFASRRCTLVTVLEILSRKGVTFCVMPDHSRQVRSGISFSRPTQHGGWFFRSLICPPSFAVRHGCIVADWSPKIAGPLERNEIRLGP